MDLKHEMLVEPAHEWICSFKTLIDIRSAVSAFKSHFKGTDQSIVLEEGAISIVLSIKKSMFTHSKSTS